MDVTEICEQLIQHTRSTEETQTPRTATSGSPAPQADPHESIMETKFKKLWVIFHEHRKRGENDTHRCLCGPQRQVTSTPACVYSASTRPPLLVRRSAGGRADGGPSRPRLVLFLILSLRRKTSVSLMKIIKWEREFQFKITSVRGDTLETWLSSEAWPRGHLEPVSTLSFGGERSRDMFLLKGEGLLNCHCPHRLRSPHHNGETEADRKQSVEC